MNKNIIGFFIFFFSIHIVCMEENTLVPMQRAYKKMYQNAIKSFDSDINFYTSQLKELSRLGYSPAQYELARFNYYQKDLSSAEMYLRLAADKGLPQAQFEYGMKLLDQREVFKGLIYIEGAAEDRSVSVKSERGYSTIKTLGDKYAKAVLEDVKNGFIRVQDRKTDGLEFKKLVFATKQIENNETNDSSGRDNFKIEELSKDEELTYTDPFDLIINLIRDGKSDKAFTELTKHKNLLAADTQALQNVLKVIPEQASSVLGMRALLTKDKKEKTHLLSTALVKEDNNGLITQFYQLYKKQVKVPELIRILFSKNIPSDFKNIELCTLVKRLQPNDFEELSKINALEGLWQWTQDQSCGIEEQLNLAKYFIKFEKNGKKAKWKQRGFDLLQKNNAGNELIDLLEYALNENKSSLAVELLERLNLLSDSFYCSKLQDKKSKIYKILASEAKQDQFLDRLGNISMTLFDKSKMFDILMNIKEIKPMLLCAQMADSKSKKPEDFISKAYEYSQKLKQMGEIISFTNASIENFALVYNCEAIPNDVAADVLEEYIYKNLFNDNSCTRPELALYTKLRQKEKTRKKNNKIQSITKFLEPLSDYCTPKEKYALSIIDSYHDSLDFFYNSDFFQDQLAKKSELSNTFFLKYFSKMNQWIAFMYVQEFENNSGTENDKSVIEKYQRIIRGYDRFLLFTDYLEDTSLILNAKFNQLQFYWQLFSVDKKSDSITKMKALIDELLPCMNSYTPKAQARFDDIRFEWLKTNIKEHLQDALPLFEQLVETEQSIHFQKYHNLAVAYRNGTFFGSSIERNAKKEQEYVNKGLEIGCYKTLGHQLAMIWDENKGVHEKEALDALLPFIEKSNDVAIKTQVALDYCLYDRFDIAQELIAKKSEGPTVFMYKEIAECLIHYGNKEYEQFCEYIAFLFNRYLSEMHLKNLITRYQIVEKIEDVLLNENLKNEKRILLTDALFRYKKQKNCLSVLTDQSSLDYVNALLDTQVNNYKKK